MYTTHHMSQTIPGASTTPAEGQEKGQHTQLLQGGWTFSLLWHLKLGLGYAVVSVLAVVMASTFIACTFDAAGIPAGCTPPNCPINFNDARWLPEEIDIIAENASLATLAEPRRWQTVNGGGWTRDFQSHHGSACANATRAWVELPNGKDTIGIRIEDSIPLPSPRHTGMVYLNGWELEYTGSDDHHVKGLGVWITKVRQENNVLHWEAGGVLTDKNADDPYRVCYYYTVVMWDTDIIDAYVIQDNFEHTQTFVHEDSQTAGLRVLAGEHDGPPAPWVVPRGFGLMFTGDTVDHHLLQVAFRLDDTLLWNIPLFDRIFWESAMILKDNSTRSFIGTEMVSIVGGLRVSIRQGKNIALRPRGPASGGGCLISPSAHAEWVTVPDLPYDYAVPVLAGWDIGYPCGDHEVKKIGTRITHFYYEKAPGASRGTLRYRVASVLQDKNADDGLVSRYRVNVLGFNRD
jgi:hypothetical protein